MRDRGYGRGPVSSGARGWPHAPEESQERLLQNFERKREIKVIALGLVTLAVITVHA